MRVLITGKNGYLARCLKDKLLINNIEVEQISLRDNTWKETSFVGYDVLVHCVALVHENEEQHSLEEYTRINVGLTRLVGEKAKAEGVKHFVFMSTRAVYGFEGSCFYKCEVDENTAFTPKTKYGITKMWAENELKKLQDSSFNISIVRAPFVYGKGCKGNYSKLKHMIFKYRFIPIINNNYSMIYIENLCELLFQIIKNNVGGDFMPQDIPLHSTSDMAILIAKYNHIPIIKSRIFNPIIYFFSIFSKTINTAFGNATYSKSISGCKGIRYNIVDFEEGIRRIEKD